MRTYSAHTRATARKYRSEGKTYSEIVTLLGFAIPKATLATWFKGIELSESQIALRKSRLAPKLQSARDRAQTILKERRSAYFDSVSARNQHLKSYLSSRDVAKICLGMLYLAEGSKNSGKSLCFANSNPAIISFYLRLLRSTYVLDESKFRCTVQARADQDLAALEDFWHVETSIPKSQFCSSRTDPRSIGKKTVKAEYKGVCRVDYFSADLLYEILAIGNDLIRLDSKMGP